MSDEEVFGPPKQTRKPISPAEFSQPPQNPSGNFEKVRKFQESMGNEAVDNVEGPRITGAVPPELAARLNRNQGKDQSPMRVAETSRMQQKDATPHERKENAQMRVTGSSKLEDLIAGAKEAAFTYEKITLPSLGKFYDGEDGPSDGILHIRPMTGEEESILATHRFVRNGAAINMIFNRCMRETFQSENFLSQDRTFLLIWLRGISYGPNYNVELTCPYTDKKFNYTIDLNLDVDLCPDNFDISSLEGNLPVTGYHYRYRLSRGRDELEVQHYQDGRQKRVDVSTQADDTLIHRTAMLVEDIEGLNDKKELEMLLKKLPVADGGLLRNLVGDPPFGVNTKVTVNSPFTLEDFEVSLPLELGFFFPKHQRTDSTPA